ncbi:hypothetical protein SDRG_03841 [Saprolegnia diclina VS20]|uniref:Uncharacterized protein n=1 Tax=Saprolegnia diclina (strain VS20) TaxID=1156394 RepID=T0S1I3_SAPDV|nr:hypothetical protein SDRG_03841 [Saprolegnia diclina VS20]EQC38883.1 hypothetical protein SDRG_03841 [Saprolegnia diclina VS20]|eukprot:XP_008607707.1 hypothetical protein SDRG_03841 [Saprolegnia diclina VS20]
MTRCQPKSKAVILVGGHEDRYFRPLSMDQPKPLFPIAGRPMLYHHVEACAKVPHMTEILLIGGHDEGLFARFLDIVMREILVPIRYLQEREPLGTAGGLRVFFDEIMLGSPDMLFVLHYDICCSFPLQDMVYQHLRTHASCTMLGKRVFPDEAKTYGCIVADDACEVVHWAEKPETFVSDLINCGIYLFNIKVLGRIMDVGDARADARRTAQASRNQPRFPYKPLFHECVNGLSLEQDILIPMAGQQELYVYETGDFWCQIKTPGMAVMCSELYMQRYRYVDPTLLSSTGGKLSPHIEGNVVIDPSATIHPSAKLGPNVVIAAGVSIGKGVRVAHSIVLAGATIKDHACVLFSILGWNCTVGEWARVEGEPPNDTMAKPTGADTSIPRDVTIFGTSVLCAPEIIVRNCVVLPRKVLTQSCHNEILL